jgi:sugar lactone lactonase YvrE
MHKITSLGFVLGATSALVSFAACSKSDENATGAAVTATTATTAATGTGGSGTGGMGTGGMGTGGMGTGGMGTGGMVGTPVVIAPLDPTKGELPEGVWAVGNSAFIGMAPTGVIQKVDLTTGMVSPFGSITVPMNNAAFTLGITTDAANNVYVGQSAAMPGPQPGVYKFASTGGAQGMPWAKDAAMNFPNALYLDGTSLYVADSGGTIFKIDTTNAMVTKWSTAMELQGPTGCMFGAMFPIGANGIVKVGDAFYVANTNLGSLLRIPITNGMAGTPVVVVKDCNTLGGIDGIAADTNGNILAVINSQSKLVSITPTGMVKTLFSGAPLSNPASIVLATVKGKKTAVITNASFFTMPPKPGIVTIPLE